MRAKIIAVVNQKGGVGKTTTAVNLSACLVERRCRVLMVDLDPQANATSALGLAKSEGASVYRALLGAGDLESSIQTTDYRNFDVIPSELDLAGAEVDLVTSPDHNGRLRRVLEPVAESDRYDYIFLDCPPSLGMLTINALVAADSVLIPLQCEYFALEGLSTITSVIDQIRDNGANPGLRVDGILMTMYTKATKLARQVVQEVCDHFGEAVYDTMIPRTVRLAEAPSFGKPVIVYDTASTGATAYRLLAREFMRRHERKDTSTAADSAQAEPAQVPDAAPSSESAASMAEISVNSPSKTEGNPT